MLPAKERANSNFIWSSFQHAQITHLVLILPGSDLKTMCPAAAHSAVSYLAAATSAWLSNSRSDPGRCWERRGLAASLSVPADGEGETEAALCRSMGVPTRVAPGWVGEVHAEPLWGRLAESFGTSGTPGACKALAAAWLSVAVIWRGQWRGWWQLIIWQLLLLNNYSKG